MKSCDFQSFFGLLYSQMPTADTGNEHFLFSRETLPPLPSLLVTDRLVIKKTIREYNAHWCTDMLLFYASKATYGHLGLLILTVAFCDSPVQVQVTLTQPASDIKTLIVTVPHPKLEQLPPGYYTRPHKFLYWPASPEPYPWRDTKTLDPTEFPCFYLIGHQLGEVSQTAWQSRDTLRGFGNDRGNVLLAELLLNASRPENPVLEYRLESDGGIRGVGPRSTEVILCLPGSSWWDDTE